MSHMLREWRGKVYHASLDDGYWHSDEWLALRQLVFRRDKNTCLRCDKRFRLSDLNAHHLIPRAEGGPDDPTNLVTLCEACHDFVEIEGLRTHAAIIGSHETPKAIKPGVAVTLPVDDDPYHRPEWHRYVYGGVRRRGKR